MGTDQKITTLEVELAATRARLAALEADVARTRMVLQTRQLQVLDRDGRLRMVLGLVDTAATPDVVGLVVQRADGTPAVVLHADPGSAGLSLTGPDGELQASIQADRGGGAVQLLAPAGSVYSLRPGDCEAAGAAGGE